MEFQDLKEEEKPETIEALKLKILEKRQQSPIEPLLNRDEFKVKSLNVESKTGFFKKSLTKAKQRPQSSINKVLHIPDANVYQFNLITKELEKYLETHADDVREVILKKKDIQFDSIDSSLLNSLLSQWVEFIRESVKEESHNISIGKSLKFMMQKEFLPFDDKESALIDLIMDQKLKASEVLVSAFSVTLTRRVFACLKSGQWLNDEIINFYMQLLGKRKTLSKNYFFNTFFYTKLGRSGYAGVKRWTRKFDLFSYDKIFVPIHQSAHWTLAVINLRDKRFEYYDSLGGFGDRVISDLADYMEEEWKDKKGGGTSPTHHFTHYQPSSEVPQQSNSHDCGVFTCQFANFVSQDFPLTFSMSNMAYYRR
eukprot:CAMPEP_0117419814 /NCGR_PEP_ID=MMETSP0758-20121206/1295_1 /TAXON_ID=63605 /ORGANISM="Percolomonas cosmopolitus, Strain AE-1 (ATCC 50343)" /LENGTH=367 /DNA_ID=CAMNT_0005201093 /DNA_START=638 /DNA_END=1737 /DNA_ORIENTATION=+